MTNAINRQIDTQEASQEPDWVLIGDKTIRVDNDPVYRRRRAVVALTVSALALLGAVKAGTTAVDAGKAIVDRFNGIECDSGTKPVAIEDGKGYFAAVQGETDLNGANIMDVVSETEELNGIPNAQLIGGQIVQVYESCNA